MDPRLISVPDPSVVVLVGAAGAGKSTFAARHFAPEEVLSSDAFRALISGDAGNQRATGPAFVALHRALFRRVAARQLIVVDATNVQGSARRGLVARAESGRVPVVAIVFDLPDDVVLARNAGRTAGAVVPDEVVRSQLAALARSFAPDRPDAWARFDAVHRLRSAAEIDSVRIVRAARG